MPDEVIVPELPPLTDDEFAAIQEEMRRRKEEGIKNRPAPQGDYQWEGYTFLNGGFGEYQALYFKGKVIGGLFVEGSGFPNEYHELDVTGGVGKKCEPPVPLRPIK